MLPRITIGMITSVLLFLTGRAQPVYHETYRPQIHFSPRTGWMNDPNGLVYFDGTYHMFYQYFPDSTVWGPMHWGHAVSKDLIHWKQVGIALFPDSLGYIFSGSAVVDQYNTSGLAADGKTALVAVYTQHDPVGEKQGSGHFQNQSIAYSLDGGQDWIKYKHNPVLASPGLKDFRDPKVSWYPEGKKWIMAVAAGDRIIFYSSVDLKSWNKESDFGQGVGAHGGAWECPDLVPFTVDGNKIWLLIVNLNSGSIQGGSGTQYFVGNFDGHQFTTTDTLTKWADYGTDNYAGVTWSNTGTEKIFIGWMSNWQYGTVVPTVKWRSAMTLPRVLGLQKIGNSYYTTMRPVDALEKLVETSTSYKHISSIDNTPITGRTRLEFTVDDLYAFSFIFSNAAGQYVTAGYSEEKNSFFIDRTHAGVSAFDPGFAAIHYGPRISQAKNSKIILILDNSSLEMFADDGLTTMTEIFFPDQPFTILQSGSSRKPVEDVRVSQLSSIWP
jgi:fructan beta-fructosidase